MLTEEDLIAAARTRLSGFKVPKAVLFTDAMPHTAAGKIQKNVLRERYRSYFES
ncbi:AMP-binding enzyme [Mycolicibacterium hippocampi]|uniref:AMP-binding enzyme C-terminal domain-containing protein n=1 Tax=Mycolicibacterium hippocampi TaxID=659824 RepID=A0A7I9ZI49_9MYCO|nr:hypothetical protein [Mycolicibacterium hippocampi]GFH00700.1 hypothetical protein MHIP_11830 [Mycolicibacterium hippocampi]